MQQRFTAERPARSAGAAGRPAGARALTEPERLVFAAPLPSFWQRAERHLDTDPAHGLRRVWQDLQRLLQADWSSACSPSAACWTPFEEALNADAATAAARPRMNRLSPCSTC